MFARQTGGAGRGTRDRGISARRSGARQERAVTFGAKLNISAAAMRQKTKNRLACASRFLIVRV
jgi:hypothetical protein